MFLEENTDEVEFQDNLELENQIIESDTDSDGDNNMGPSEEQNYSSIIEKKNIIKKILEEKLYLFAQNKLS